MKRSRDSICNYLSCEFIIKVLTLLRSSFFLIVSKCYIPLLFLISQKKWKNLLFYRWSGRTVSEIIWNLKSSPNFLIIIIEKIHKYRCRRNINWIYRSKTHNTIILICSLWLIIGNKRHISLLKISW